MPDLILRPSHLDPKRPWALQLRYHDCCGPTEYVTLCHVSENSAREIIRAGAPFWLFGDPDKGRETRREVAEPFQPVINAFFRECGR